MLNSLRSKLVLMARMALRDSQSRHAGVIARHAVSNVDRRAPLDANALAVCHFVREWLRYAHEYPETIADLGALVRVPVGDCDDMVVCLAALLYRIGYEWEHQRFSIGYKGLQPSHVWLEVKAKKGGRWIPLDAATWKIEPGQSPEHVGGFSRVTRHPLRGLLT